MAPNNPNDDKRVEDLLSQLSGIFGRLSNTEEEEARQKVDPAPTPPQASPPPAPAPAPPPTEPVVPPMPAAEPALDPFVLQPPASTTEALVPAPAPEPVASPEITPAPSPAPEPAPMPLPPPPAVTVSPAPDASAPAPVAAPGAFDFSAVPTAIFYPAGRDKEAKLLAEKLETMTPKFTKVEFRLKVGLQDPYDPRQDWRERVVQQTIASGVRTAFVIVDRALDDMRRKQVVADLETHNVYFQDVPLLSVEKKAFYTDLLLGLIFFFDSQRRPDANPA